MLFGSSFACRLLVAATRLSCAAVLSISVVFGLPSSAEAADDGRGEIARLASPSDGDMVMVKDLYEQARELFRLGRYDEAAAAFQRVLEVVPDHPQARMFLQSAQSKSRHNAGGTSRAVAAESTAAAVRRAEPIEIASANDAASIAAKADEFYKEALAHYKKKEYADAKAKLQRATALVADHAKANELLNRIVADETKARQEAEQRAAAEEAAQTQAKAKDEQAARKQQVAAYLNQAREYNKAGEYDKARAALDEVLRIDPENQTARKELERLADAQDKARAAEEAAAEKTRAEEAAAMARAREEQVRTLLRQAEEARRAGDLVQADALQRQAAELAPDHKDVVKTQSRIEKSAAEATKVAEVSAEKTKVAAEKAQEQARQAEARAEAEQKAAIVKQLLREAEAELAADDPQGALDLLRQVEDIETGNREAASLREKAEKLAAKQQVEAAAKAEAAKAAAREQQLQQLLDSAKRHLEEGKYSEAREQVRLASELSSDNHETEKLLRQIDQAEAKAEADAARQAESDKEAAIVQRSTQMAGQARELAAEGRFADAVTVAEEAVAMAPQNPAAQEALKDIRRQAEEAAARESRLASEQEAASRQAKVNELIQEGDRALAAGDYSAAIQSYSQALGMDAKNRTASRQLALARKEAEQAEKRAAEAARAAEREAKQAAKAAERAATQTAKQAEGQVATAAEREVVSSAAQEAADRLELGKQYYREGNLDAAMREFQRVLAIQPNEPTAVMFVERIRGELDGRTAATGVAVEPEISHQPAAAEASRRSSAEQALANDAEQAAVARGKVFYNAGQWDEAEAEFEAALEINPRSAEAKQYLDRIAADRASQAQASAASAAQRESEAKLKAQARGQQLFDDGMKYWMNGQVIEAYHKWQEALQADPGNETVKTYLDNTKAEYEQALRGKETELRLSQQEAQYEARMNEPSVTLELPNADIVEVINILGTVSGFNIIAGDGVAGRVTMNIKDKSLRETLDLMLTRYGFGWERIGNDIFIRPAFVTKTFQLDEDQYNKLRKILDDPQTLRDPSQALQYILYGELGRNQIQGRLLELNDKTRMLLVKDSEANVKAVEDFLQNIPAMLGEAEPLISRQYVLNPEISDKVYNLISLALYGDKQLPGRDARGRLLLLEQETDILIVKDTQENIETVERILEDQKLMRSILEGDLVAKQFRITDDLDRTPEAEIRRQSIVQQTAAILEAMLYGRDGRQAAIAMGRQLFANWETGTIDVVDTPANIKKVESYLQSVEGSVDETVSLKRIPIKSADPFYVARFIGQFLLGTDQGPRRVYIQETLNTNVGGRARSGRGSGTAGGQSFNPLNPTSRGARESSSRAVGTIPRELVGEAHIQVEPNSATLVVMANDAFLMSWIETLVEFLDVRPRQVEIEARLVEVNLNEARERGGSLLVNFENGLSRLGDVGNIFDWPGQMDFLTNQAGQSTLTLQSIGGKTQVDLLFQFLNSLDSTEVLSAPKIVSMSAPDFVPSIIIATQEPFISRAEFDDQGDDDPTNNRINFEFETEIVGIQLSVYPVITGDNHIYLDVMPNVSLVTGRLPVVVDFGNAADVPGALNVGSLGVPIIDRRLLYNTVVLADGQTLIMGGLTRDELVESARRMPGLSTIPILGVLFKQTSHRTIKSTLLIFVSVNIIKE